MSTFLKAYKVRLYPDKEQEELLKKQIGCSRFVHNQLLGLCQRRRKAGKSHLSTFDLIKALPVMKEKWPWLKEVDSDALQKSAQDLGTGYSNFFNSLNGKRKGKKMGAPRFKKHSQGGSFRIENKNRVNYDSENRTLSCGKHKNIRYRGTSPHTPARTITISYNGHKWFASILVQETIKRLPKTKRSVGIDPGVSTFLSTVTSDGKEKKVHPQALTDIQELMARISILQMWKDKKTRGSSRHKSLGKKITHLWEQVRNKRLNMIHHASKRLVEQFDRIHIEDTQVKNMVKKGGRYKTGLNRAIHTVSLGILKDQLAYKAEWYQKQVVFVAARNTSKTCSSCGEINKELTLRDRRWECTCGAYHDRDLNAARNILALGYL